MSTLRFRAWHDWAERMVYPCDIHELCFEKKGRWYITNCKAFGMEYDHEINNVTGVLMQSTGLRDVKGVEIFEGDIVKWPQMCAFIGEQPYESGEVMWDEQEARYVVRIPGRTSSYLLTRMQPECIGNIYQNPELLHSAK